MYCLINKNIHAVLGSMPPKDVQKYDALIDDIAELETPEYQRRYQNFWQMNSARLCPEFRKAYFESLQKCLISACPPTITALTDELYQTPSHKKNERRSIQFSFASKLLHMIDRESAIYDDLVADFFFWKPPSTGTIGNRIQRLGDFHAFLNREYSRILNDGLLHSSIQIFRQKFNPRNFTNRKIIDSLIWGYVRWLRKGALIQTHLRYQ